MTSSGSPASPALPSDWGLGFGGRGLGSGQRRLRPDVPDVLGFGGVDQCRFGQRDRFGRHLEREPQEPGLCLPDVEQATLPAQRSGYVDRDLVARSQRPPA